MTRIIGGHAGSLSLVTPGLGTRPTSDRVREAWFSKLDAHGALEHARVLDLYAGSGALGLEAASRGATRVTLVDSHPDAVRAMTRNVRSLEGSLPHAPAIEVVKKTVAAFLNSPATAYDLVFLDPPYDLASADLEAALAALAPWLSADAWVMLERSTRSHPPQWPAGVEGFETKTYGETILYFARAS